MKNFIRGIKRLCTLEDFMNDLRTTTENKFKTRQRNEKNEFMEINMDLLIKKYLLQEDRNLS